MQSPRCAVIHRGTQVTFVAKLQNDGWYWLKLDRATPLYLPYARVTPFKCFGELQVEHASVPVHTTSDRTSGHQPNLTYPDQHQFIVGQPLQLLTAPEWTAIQQPPHLLQPRTIVPYQTHIDHGRYGYLKTERGFLPYVDHQTGHFFGSDSDQSPVITPEKQSQTPYIYWLTGQYQLTKRAVWARTAPDRQAMPITKLRNGTRFDYLGKVYHDHRGWLVIKQQSRYLYVPFVTVLNAKLSDYYGLERTGSKLVGRLQEPWTFVHQNPTTIRLQPTSAELTALNTLEAQLDRVRQPDSQVIGLINDLHLDRYQTPATATGFHDLSVMSAFARRAGLDALVVNGDLNDGRQTLDRTIQDIGTAVAILKTSQRPFFITQGNHDDNSGFARYVNGYRTEQVVTRKLAYQLRNHAFEHLLAESGHFYGRYQLPNSRLSLILLDAFDIPDSFKNGYFARGYDEAPSGIHWTGILQNIRHSRSRFQTAQVDWLIKTLTELKPDEQVLIFTHDSLRQAATQRAVGQFWTYDWFANNQQGDYHRLTEALSMHRHQIVAVMSGHTHVDDWADTNGINWITTTSNVADRRKSHHGHTKNGLTSAWDLLVVNPSNRELYRFRVGWQDRSGHISSWQVRLFGDGTDPRHRSLRDLLKQFKPTKQTENTKRYNQLSQQVTQVWRGFRSYFTY